MIGQTHLQSSLNLLIANGTFPRFSIFVGPKGSGKKTVAQFIRHKFRDALFADIGIGVDAIRDIISNVYKVTSPIIYLIADADNMSNAAKNALLKVTEEPPNNAYFIMTLEDENNTLDTIRSRGTVFHMDRYTPDEIEEYARIAYLPKLTHDPIITDLCETPGDVDILVKMGIQEFYDYVQLVVDNIAEVSLANVFKISSKIALKDDAEGYDLRLFWKAFYKVCGDRFFVSLEQKYFEPMGVTNEHLQKLKVKGINRQMLFDNWILEIRNLWM